MKDTKVIGNEECIPQHKLLVTVFKTKSVAKKPSLRALKLKIWRLRENSVQEDFQTFILNKFSEEASRGNVEERWQKIKKTLLTGANTICGKTKGG